MKITGSTDLRNAQRKLESLSASRMRQFNSAVNQEIGSSLVTQIRNSAPKDTGKYSRSWKITKRSAAGVQVGTNLAWLFKILEYTGSKPHLIRPVRAKALHFFLKDGTEIFTQLVRHPGFKPIPHVRPSVRHVMKHTKYIIRKHLANQQIVNNSTTAQYRNWVMPIVKVVKK